MADKVAGYSAELRQHGQAIFSKNWLSAKRSQDGNENWTSDVQLHDSQRVQTDRRYGHDRPDGRERLSPDAQIIDYLPDYWAKRPNIEYIVFRNLFNHTSGIFQERGSI